VLLNAYKPALRLFNLDKMLRNQKSHTFGMFPKVLQSIEWHWYLKNYCPDSNFSGKGKEAEDGQSSNSDHISKENDGTSSGKKL